MIPGIKKILYATDLSKNADFALGYAVRIAMNNNAKISVINVIEELSHNYDLQHERLGLSEEKNNVIETIKNQMKYFSEHEKLDGCMYSQLVENIIIKAGSPVAAIIGQTKAEDYDLIVMGTHGHGVLFNALIGSTARKMVQISEIPVLVVRIPDPG